MDPVLQWVLGGIVTVSIAVVGGFLKYLFSTIHTHKQETTAAIEKLRVDTEARRHETRDMLLELINTKFDAIWESIRNLNDKVT